MTPDIQVFRPLADRIALRHPVVGRRAEVEQALDRITRPGASRLFILGPAGAGKSEFVWAIARALAEAGELDAESRHELYDVDFDAILTDTVRVTEEIARFLEAGAKNLRQILWIDDLVRIFNRDTAHAHSVRRLRDALHSGKMSFIAAGTREDIAKLRSVEPQLLSSVQVICLEPATEDQTFKVLRRLSADLTGVHGVGISNGAIRAAVDLTHRYLPGGALPGKAVEVLEKAVFRYTRKRDVKCSAPAWELDPDSMARLGSKVSFYDVKRVVEELASVDIDADKAAQWTEETSRRLLKRVYGQDVAVQKLAAALAGIRVRFGRAGRPAGMLLLAGPPGVGKLHAVTTLAESVLSSDADLVRFDMRRYSSADSAERLFGQIPGRPGPNPAGELFEAIRDKSFTFIVFEHADAAPLEAVAVFEAIASRGYIRDYLGNKLRFKRSVLVFLCDTKEWLAPDGESTDSVYDFAAKLMPRSLTQWMDAVIPFGPLGPEARLWIVRDRIEQFQRSLPDPRAEIRIDKRLLAALAEPNGIDGGVAQSLRQRAEETVLKPIRAYLAEHASDETRELSVTAREGKIDIQSG